VGDHAPGDVGAELSLLRGQFADDRVRRPVDAELAGFRNFDLEVELFSTSGKLCVLASSMVLIRRNDGYIRGRDDRCIACMGLRTSSSQRQQDRDGSAAHGAGLGVEKTRILALAGDQPDAAQRER
jgi:hypothetical protein